MIQRSWLKDRGLKKVLRDGESNPGLPRDRRGYSPLYYRGVVHNCSLSWYKLWQPVFIVKFYLQICIYCLPATDLKPLWSHDFEMTSLLWWRHHIIWHQGYRASHNCYKETILETRIVTLSNDVITCDVIIYDVINRFVGLRYTVRLSKGSIVFAPSLMTSLPEHVTSFWNKYSNYTKSTVESTNGPFPNWVKSPPI